MLQTIKDIFSVKDLRKKILFTLFILLLFRLGTYITIPGVDKIALRQAVGAEDGRRDGRVLHRFPDPAERASAGGAA